MLGLFHSLFSEFSFDSVAKSMAQNKPKYVYRDDLDKKMISSPSKLIKKRDKGEEGEEAAKVPLLQREDQGKQIEIREKSGVQVKILMTKEEASRLLSKRKEGGVLEFRDVARELVQIPSSRVTVVSSSSTILEDLKYE